MFAAADQARIMQEQMTGAAMAMPPDPNKAFKVRRASLTLRLKFMASDSHPFISCKLLSYFEERVQQRQFGAAGIGPDDLLISFLINVFTTELPKAHTVCGAPTTNKEDKLKINIKRN